MGQPFAWPKWGLSEFFQVIQKIICFLILESSLLKRKIWREVHPHHRKVSTSGHSHTKWMEPLEQSPSEKEIVKSFPGQLEPWMSNRIPRGRTHPVEVLRSSSENRWGSCGTRAVGSIFTYWQVISQMGINKSPVVGGSSELPEELWENEDHERSKQYYQELVMQRCKMYVALAVQANWCMEMGRTMKILRKIV